MRKIEVDNDIAFIDDDIYDLVSQYKWYRMKGKYTYYAVTNMKCSDGRVRTQYLHRLVMGLEPGERPETIVHHRDENGMNNQKSNLETTDARGNQLEIGKRKTNTSGFLGVTFDKTSKKKPWKSQSQVKGKTKTIGRFETKEEAARARDLFVLKIHGRKAHFNFPDELPK